MDKYEKVYPIAKGSLGLITKIRRIKDKEILVCKEIDVGKLNNEQIENLVEELAFLSNTRHPHLVECLDVWSDLKAKKVFIVMEYCEKGNLHELINDYKIDNDRIPEEFIWKVLKQVLLGIQVCKRHEQNSSKTRALTPKKILFDGLKQVKLAYLCLEKDLGQASDLPLSIFAYLPPEILSNNKNSEKAKVWSLGCILYEMVTLDRLFTGETFEQLVEKISKGSFEANFEGYSDDLYKIIIQMLNADPELRPSISEIFSHSKLSFYAKNIRSSGGNEENTYPGIEIDFTGSSPIETYEDIVQDLPELLLDGPRRSSEFLKDSFLFMDYSMNQKSVLQVSVYEEGKSEYPIAPSPINRESIVEEQPLGLHIQNLLPADDPPIQPLKSIHDYAPQPPQQEIKQNNPQPTSPLSLKGILLTSALAVGSIFFFKKLTH